MKLIQYIGNRPSKTDNVAGTGLTWLSEQILPVNDVAAKKLLGFPAVWREIPEPKPAPKLAPKPAQSPPEAPTPWVRPTTRARALERIA